MNNKNFLFVQGIWSYEPYGEVMTAVRGHKYHIIPNNNLPFTISFAILFLIFCIISDLHLSLYSITIDNFLSKNVLYLYNHCSRSLLPYIWIDATLGIDRDFEQFCIIPCNYFTLETWSMLEYLYNVKMVFWAIDNYMEEFNLFFDSAESILKEGNLSDYLLSSDTNNDELNKLILEGSSTFFNFKTKIFFFYENYNQIGPYLYLHWFGAFLLTLGLFLIWCCKAVEEGSLIKLMTINKFSKLKNYSSDKYVALPLYHTDIVRKGFKIGFILFIISEIMFFFGFFWAFFHSSLSPSIQIGAVWPPVDVDFITVKGFAIANTVILLTSGMTLTVAHYSFELIPQKGENLLKSGFKWVDNEYSYISKSQFYSIQRMFHNLNTEHLVKYDFPIFTFLLKLLKFDFYKWNYFFYIPYQLLLNSKKNNFFISLNRKETEKLIRVYINLMLDVTVLLAFLFMLFQGIEYFISPVTIDSGVYGSTFYMTTGLHGAHVFIGTCFLIYCRMASSIIQIPSIFINFYDIITNAAYKFNYLMMHTFPPKGKGYEGQCVEFPGAFVKTNLLGKPLEISTWYYGKNGIESFECAAWYWHFVDVVWIFVFAFIYVWSHLTVLNY